MKLYTIHSTVETYVEAETEEEALKIVANSFRDAHDTNFLEDYVIDAEMIV